MKVLIFFFSLFIASSAVSQDEHYSAMLAKANEVYKTAEYDSALALYNQVIQSGLASYELHYNVGNAYFKTGNVPSAILQYERALKLKPNASDARFNLTIANESIVDKIENLPNFFISDWWQSFVQTNKMDSWAWYCLASFLLFLLSVIIFLNKSDAGSKRLFFFGAILSLSCSVLFFSAAQSSYQQRFEKDHGIIFRSSITVQSAPASNSGDLFVLHEGTKVQILKKENSWYNIRLADGNEGWMPMDAVEII